MTIAVGLRCRDGLILCADTLLSARYRTYGPKLWLGTAGKVELGITGAGDYVLVKRAAADMLNRLKAGMSLDAVREDVITPVLTSLYTDHIDHAPEWRQQQGYDLHAIVGLRLRDEFRLYETSRRVLAPVESFSCVGAGAPVANYTASIFHNPTFSVDWGQILAAYVIQQTKAYGEDCGGDTNIVVMKQGEPARALSSDKVRELEQVGTRLHEACGPLLRGCADAADNRSDVVAGLKSLYRAIEDSRRAVIGEDVDTFMRSARFERALSRAIGQPVPRRPTRGQKRRPPSRG